MPKTSTPGFQPQRLQQALDAYGLTGVAFSNMTGIAESSLSDYRNGHSTPSIEHFNKIVEVLQYPRNFFLTEPTSKLNGLAWFRSMSTATQSTRKKLYSRLEWLDEITQYLSSWINFPSANLPIGLDFKTEIEQIDSVFIEKTTRQIREHWNFSGFPIPNLVRALERNGFVVARGLQEVEKLDGLSFFSKQTKPYIFLLEGKGSAVRSRFDAAHELGHFVLHQKIDVKHTRDVIKNRILEDQAHRFASSILLPREEFLSDVLAPTLDSFLSLKSKWNVSIACMIMRCYDLDVINEEQKTNLFKNLSRRGWKIKEPLDDKLIPEKPVLLSQAIQLLVGQHVKSKEEILHDLPLPAQELIKICSLPEYYFDDENRIIELKLPKEHPTDRNQGDAEILLFSTG
jgi:Zn-dependent peptidase ImmA (M78 family)